MLSRLSLNLTQVCNLGCKYCYAQGGDYGGPAEKMTADTAIAKLKEAARAHSEIKLIQFFGGEPLLNYKLIRDVTREVKLLVESGLLKYEPAYGIVTNLTVLNDDAADLLRDIKCDVVVSIDGPPEIHDALRSTKRGKPTHSTIMENLNRLRNRGVRFDIEVTYSKRHLDLGISVIDLLKYFAPMGPKIIQIANAADRDLNIGFVTKADQDRCIQMHEDALNYALDKLDEGILVPYGLFKDMMQSILSEGDGREKKERKHYCTASTTNLSVSSSGKFYACHMFTNNEKYEVDPAELGPRKNITSRDDHPQCQVCWARHWCTACVGNFEILSPGDPKPSRTHCEVTRRGFANVLTRLSGREAP